MKYKVKELCEINSDNISKTDNFNFINYLDTSNLTRGSISEIQKLVVGKDKIPSRAKRKVKVNDILISTVRPNQRHYGIIKKGQEELIVSTGFAVLSPDTTKVNPNYLYWYLTQDSIINYLQSIAETSTSAYPSIKPSVIGELELDLPELDEQKAIANILSTLDEKTETNDQTNQNLEEMAQALFKHWFVDFEFPNENGEPYKSSGGEMVKSELGIIPKGWRIEKIGDISDIQNGYAFKAPEYVEKGIRVLRTLNINEKGYFDNENIVYLPKEYNNEKFKKYFFEKYDLALVMVGASIGKTGIILENTEGALQNQNMWRFRTKRKEIPQLFLINVVKQAQKISQNWSTGSAREFYRKDSFSKIKVLIPQDNLLKQYDSLVFPMFERISNNTQENDRLVLIRDTLLPKLMSGVVRVPLEDGVLEEQGLK